MTACTVIWLNPSIICYTVKYMKSSYFMLFGDDPPQSNLDSIDVAVRSIYLIQENRSHMEASSSPRKKKHRSNKRTFFDDSRNEIWISKPNLATESGSSWVQHLHGLLTNRNWYKTCLITQHRWCRGYVHRMGDMIETTL